MLKRKKSSPSLRKVYKKVGSSKKERVSNVCSEKNKILRKLKSCDPKNQALDKRIWAQVIQPKGGCWSQLLELKKKPKEGGVEDVVNLAQEYECLSMYGSAMGCYKEAVAQRHFLSMQAVVRLYSKASHNEYFLNEYRSFWEYCALLIKFYTNKDFKHQYKEMSKFEPFLQQLKDHPSVELSFYLSALVSDQLKERMLSKDKRFRYTSAAWRLLNKQEVFYTTIFKHFKLPESFYLKFILSEVSSESSQAFKFLYNACIDEVKCLSGKTVKSLFEAIVNFEKTVSSKYKKIVLKLIGMAQRKVPYSYLKQNTSPQFKDINGTPVRVDIIGRGRVEVLSSKSKSICSKKGLPAEKGIVSYVNIIVSGTNKDSFLLIPSNSSKKNPLGTSAIIEIKSLVVKSNLGGIKAETTAFGSIEAKEMSAEAVYIHDIMDAKIPRKCIFKSLGKLYIAGGCMDKHFYGLFKDSPLSPVIMEGVKKLNNLPGYYSIAGVVATQIVNSKGESLNDKLLYKDNRNFGSYKIVLDYSDDASKEGAKMFKRNSRFKSVFELAKNDVLKLFRHYIPKKCFKQQETKNIEKTDMKGIEKSMKVTIPKNSFYVYVGSSYSVKKEKGSKGFFIPKSLAHASGGIEDRFGCIDLNAKVKWFIDNKVSQGGFHLYGVSAHEWMHLFSLGNNHRNFNTFMTEYGSFESKSSGHLQERHPPKYVFDPKKGWVRNEISRGGIMSSEINPEELQFIDQRTYWVWVSILKKLI